ncbi:M1 family metallopeptidase [Candidatus Phycosocius spiralis]|uniref:Aminopeptidase n=1 Tax=Candidatus Phycosocius spiralis TaxID=2815099 RepID=A0ABQ4PST5_9PROT|nr:M1 family metallopeptidase [Candidatus Phycosocius spiralis]GIU65979.1 aminopeptidase [Candidatus Phycosocius spiralis]
MKHLLIPHLLVVALCATLTISSPVHAQAIAQTKGDFQDKFRQLDPEDAPTPNDYRAASGAPGHRYWQQKVDYKMNVTLDEASKSLKGSADIIYTNNSPDTLNYLWLMLDQNDAKKNSIAELTSTMGETGRITFDQVRRAQAMRDQDGGFTITRVTDPNAKPLVYDVVDTLLRVDLASPLKPGESVAVKIDWTLAIRDTRLIGGRSGYECFTKADQDGNCIFLAAQWFPRAAVYSDYEGWHNKSFLGRGEFTLEFGDYDVEITLPADFAVSSTGELQNPDEVLTPTQRERLAKAKTSYTDPVYIITPQEAESAEKSKTTKFKTWRFTANNVRDFAWAGSRKFIWDAMAVRQESGQDVLAMSFFPKEGDPLWSAYSTKSIAHTIHVYGRMTFPYPYKVAQSVNGPVGGMEYPMITFNGPRPEKDKAGNLTYSDRTKYGLISVVIHEVGHIWFPMIVNSDERQWTWMDEGLNTFLQYVAEQEWSKAYPSRRGDPRDLIEYMRSNNQVPIMTQSDSIQKLGDNAYGKPATALVILRETIIGRARFDRAFKEYAQRWRFKRPTPYDFFRTMEESSGTDLDWFWRGWFYSTDHVDIALSQVREGTIDTQDPDTEAARRIRERDAKPIELGQINNTGIKTYADRDPKVLDYYDRTDPLAATKGQKKRANSSRSELTPQERAVLDVKDRFYSVSLENKGGLVSPVILKFSFKDGSNDTITIPAEIWRYDARRVNWTYITAKEVTQVELDPRQETADVDRSNNYFPTRIEPTRLEVYKANAGPPNQMQDNDLAVTPNSLETKPAVAPKPEVGGQAPKLK